MTGGCHGVVVRGDCRQRGAHFTVPSVALGCEVMTEGIFKVL